MKNEVVVPALGERNAFGVSIDRHLLFASPGEPGLEALPETTHPQGIMNMPEFRQSIRGSARAFRDPIRRC